MNIWKYLMNKNPTFLAIIPARAGSKRLPKKNILDLCSKPLIAYSIEAALKSQHINKVVLSSEDDNILNIAQNYGAHIIKRPKELATDTSSSFDTIKHAIETLEPYDYIVLLQPTSPLRNEKHIDEAIELLLKKEALAVISVCEAEHSPLWCNILPQNNSLENFLNQEIINKRSQDLPQYYRLNGAIYIVNTKALLKDKSFFLKENIFAYKMDAQSSVDIDTELDFLLAQTILQQQTSKKVNHD